MNGIVIGAGQLSIHSIKCAMKLGIRTIALDGNGNATGLNMADESHIVDVSNEQLTVDALKSTHPKISIPVPVGRILTTTGRVNDTFGLKGISRESAELCTDKYKFHKLLKKNGLRQIICRSVKSRDDIKELTNSDFPMILKPRHGSGSKGVIWLDNVEAARKVFCRTDFQRSSYIIEQAVQGEEYGVDAVVIHNQLHIVLIRKKLLSAPPVRQSLGYIAMTDQTSDLYRRTRTHLCAAATAIGFRDCILHADIIVGPNEIFLIEISGRPAGHYLYDVFTPFATGVDMVREFLRYQKDECFNLNTDRIRCCGIGYFDFSNKTIARVPTVKRVMNNDACNVSHWQCDIKENEKLLAFTDGPTLMKRGYFVVSGVSDKDITRQFQVVKDMFKTE